MTEIPITKSKVGTAPNFQSLNRYNSATDGSNSLKFDTEFDHITANTLQTSRFKVETSKVKVTA